MVSKENYILVKYHKNNLREFVEENNNRNMDILTCENYLSFVKNMHDVEGKCRRLKSVEKDVLFRYLDIININNNNENISQIIQKYSTPVEVDQDFGVYELIQETYSTTSDKRPYDKTIDGYILMAYKTMEDMYSEEFAHNWKVWSGIRHLCAKIPAPYHFEGMHFYKELTNICQFKYLLIIDVKKLLFYVATTLNVLQTVKPKLCAYVGVYKEIYNGNNKNDGGCNKNNIWSLTNNIEEKKNERIYVSKKGNEIKKKIKHNINEKNLSDKKKLNWRSMSNIKNTEKNSMNFEFDDEMMNTPMVEEKFNVSNAKTLLLLNNSITKNNEGIKNKEGKKKLKIQSSLPFSFLYREKLNFLYLDNNKKEEDIYLRDSEKNDSYNNNLFYTNSITMLKRNNKNYLDDLEKLRKELLMDEKYYSPIYSRNEWLTYPNHEASIMEFQFSKLINLLKS